MGSERSVIVPHSCIGLREVYEPRHHYRNLSDIEQHLQQAADKVAHSTMWHVSETEEMRLLLRLNPNFACSYEVSDYWFQQLVRLLIDRLPQWERDIQRLAETQRTNALQNIASSW